MNKSWQRFLAFVMAVFAGSVMAGAIHTWSNGETLTSADLDANFVHIHSLMVGGHGARLVDADVSASANIATSKIQNGGGIATSYVSVVSSCAGVGNCTLDHPFGITTVAETSAGHYTVTLDHTATHTMVPLITPHDTTFVACWVRTTTSTTFTFQCQTNAAADHDTAFSIAVYEHP